MWRIRLAIVFLCLVISPLGACLNDSATESDEQQFVSGYGIMSVSKEKSVTFAFILLLLPTIALTGLVGVWIKQERKFALLKPQNR